MALAHILTVGSAAWCVYFLIAGKQREHKFYQSYMNRTIMLSALASMPCSWFMVMSGKTCEKSVFVCISFLFVEIRERKVDSTQRVHFVWSETSITVVLVSPEKTSDFHTFHFHCDTATGQYFYTQQPQSGRYQQMADKTLLLNYSEQSTKTGRALVACSSATDQKRSQSSNIWCTVSTFCRHVTNTPVEIYECLHVQWSYFLLWCTENIGNSLLDKQCTFIHAPNNVNVFCVKNLININVDVVLRLLLMLSYCTDSSKAPFSIVIRQFTPMSSFYYICLIFKVQSVHTVTKCTVYAIHCVQDPYIIQFMFKFILFIICGELCTVPYSIP